MIDPGNERAPAPAASNSGEQGGDAVQLDTVAPSRPAPGEPGWRLHYSAAEAREAETELAQLARVDRLPERGLLALARRLASILRDLSAEHQPGGA